MLDRRQTFRIRPTHLTSTCSDKPVEVENISLGGAMLNVEDSNGFEDSTLIIQLDAHSMLALPFVVVARDPGSIRVRFTSMSPKQDQVLASFIIKWQQGRVMSAYKDDYDDKENQQDG